MASRGDFRRALRECAMEALFVVLAVFVLLAFPVWTLVLLHKIRRDQDHHDVLLNGVLSRLDRLASRPSRVEPESRTSTDFPPPSAARPVAPPSPAPAPAFAPPPPPPPPPPTPRPAPIPSPIPAFAADAPDSSDPILPPRPSARKPKTPSAAFGIGSPSTRISAPKASLGNSPSQPPGSSASPSSFSSSASASS